MTTVLSILTRRFPEARKTTLRQMIADKRVLIGKTPAKSFNQVVEDGQSLVVRNHAKKKTTKDALARWFDILFEDGHLLVIDKPHGLLTSSGQRDKRATAIGILLEHFGSSKDVDVGLIHRLDKDASGLLVFSKTPEAFDDLKRQFAEKSAGREYFVLVEKTQPITPKSTRMACRLLELSDGRVVRITNKHKGDQAVLDYELVEERGKFARLKVRLHTGRKHQIRVQLASRGWPIAGDPIYHPNPHAAPRLMLHARRLELTHPYTHQPLVFESKIPVDIRLWWDQQPTSPAIASKKQTRKQPLPTHVITSKKKPRAEQRRPPK